MKRELTIVSILAAIGSFMLTGCVAIKGTDGNTKFVVDTAKLAEVAYRAARSGTLVTLKAKPEYRPAFAVAEQSLSALIATANVDMDDVTKILANIGVKELAGEDGVILIQDGVFFYQLMTGLFWEPESRAGTLLVVTRLRDGMAEALGKPAGTITPGSIATPARLESNTRTF